MKKMLGYTPVPDSKTNLSQFEAQFISMRSNPIIKPMLKKTNYIPIDIPLEDSIYPEIIVPAPLDPVLYPNVENLLAPDSLGQNIFRTLSTPTPSETRINLDNQTISAVNIALEELKPALENFSSSMCSLAKNEKMFVESLTSAVGQNYFLRSSMHKKNYFGQIKWYNNNIYNTGTYLRHQFTVIKDIFAELNLYVPDFLNYILNPSKMKIILKSLPEAGLYPFGEFLQSFYQFVYTTSYSIEKIQSYRTSYIYYLAKPLKENLYTDYFSAEIGLSALLDAKIFSKNQLSHLTHIFNNPQYREENLGWVVNFYIKPFQDLRNTALQNQIQLYNSISSRTGYENLSWFSNFQNQQEFISHTQQIYSQAEICVYKKLYAQNIDEKFLDFYLENFTRLYDLTGIYTTTYTPYLFGSGLVCVGATLFYNYYYELYGHLTNLGIKYIALPLVGYSFIHLLNLNHMLTF